MGIIDYLMWKGERVIQVKVYEVISGEGLITKHRLMVMELRCSRKIGIAENETQGRVDGEINRGQRKGVSKEDERKGSVEY